MRLTDVILSAHFPVLAIRGRAATLFGHNARAFSRRNDHAKLCTWSIPWRARPPDLAV